MTDTDDLFSMSFWDSDEPEIINKNSHEWVRVELLTLKRTNSYNVVVQTNEVFLQVWGCNKCGIKFSEPLNPEQVKQEASSNMPRTVQGQFLLSCDENIMKSVMDG